MKTIIIQPERCVGCMQCRFNCAVAHSKAKNILSIFETPLSKPRIHIALSSEKEPFPNKCRHCNPAPCENACITKAIYRDEATDAALINPDRCINCGMCAMACPFGVVRYHTYLHGRLAAHKCDQCILRIKEGEKPACVEACKVGALFFDDINKFMKEREGQRVANLVYLGIREKQEPKGNSYEALKKYEKDLLVLRRR